MGKRQRGRDISGLILLDKAPGETSNTSLQRVKRLLSAAKAGHTGSLDPLATGVLPLCFGEATKISQFLLESDKAYRSRIRFGVKTDTGDREGAVIGTHDPAGLTRQRVEEAMASFQGEIEQLPSMYSALKYQGVPLYKLAREGKTAPRKSRVVTIHDIRLLEFGGDWCELEIHCSKGTYIRTIADDLGDLLGVGGHVETLRRLQAGPFHEEDCISFETLQAAVAAGGPEAGDRFLIPCDEAVSDLPAVRLPPETALYVKQGQAVIARHLPTEGLVRLYEDSGFIGIGAILEDGRVAPRRLLRN